MSFAVSKTLMASSSNCLHKFIAGKTSMSGIKFPNLRNLSKETLLYRSSRAGKCVVYTELILSENSG
jgi:hypothetical protein